jgi:hypothetical protein
LRLRFAADLRQTRIELLQLSAPDGSKEPGQQEQGNQSPADDKAQDPRKPVPVEDDTEQAQDKTERRPHNESQPAKG